MTFDPLSVLLGGSTGKPHVHQARRWFLRCPDCLSVVAVDADRPPSARCACCDVPLEPMGRVHRDRLVNDELRTPCDDRCTCAAGPICSCHCGGKNHGSGLVVEVRIDAGGIPRLMPPDSRAAHRRDEWRAAVERATTADPGRDQASRKAAGEYIGAADFERFLEHQRWTREIRRIRGLRTHHGRMAAILKLAGPAPKADAPPPAWAQPTTESPRFVRADVRVGQQVGLLG